MPRSSPRAPFIWLNYPNPIDTLLPSSSRPIQRSTPSTWLGWPRMLGSSPLVLCVRVRDHTYASVCRSIGKRVIATGAMSGFSAIHGSEQATSPSTMKYELIYIVPTNSLGLANISCGRCTWYVYDISHQLTSRLINLDPIRQTSAEAIPSTWHSPRRPSACGSSRNTTTST